MTADRWKQISRIYVAVLTKAPDAREVFLRDACGADEELRREVASLLKESHRGAVLDRVVSEQSLMNAAPVEFDPLFFVAAAAGGLMRVAVHEGGDPFLVLKPVPEQPASNTPDRLVVVENWIEELKQKVPTR